MRNQPPSTIIIFPKQVSIHHNGHTTFVHKRNRKSQTNQRRRGQDSIKGRATTSSPYLGQTEKKAANEEHIFKKPHLQQKKLFQGPEVVPNNLVQNNTETDAPKSPPLITIISLPNNIRRSEPIN